MKANELRIGNLVSFKNADFNICKVRAIYLTHFTAVNIATGIDYGDSIRTNYQPIPLTEDILVKAGCTKVVSGEYRLGNLTMQITKYESGDLVTVFFGAELINILHYVHEFQNLIFALSNKELTINL